MPPASRVKLFLEAISDLINEEHETMLIWGGSAFGPGFFSLDEVNVEIWKTLRK
jgi:hypothetical protein